MSLIFAIVGFMLMMLIVVSVHEFAHFWVARKLGVKVLQFYIGMGKPIYKYVAKDGVEYGWGLFPLGGYVRMVDEREGEVNPADLPHAFNRQSVAKRAAIVAAGPISNLILAVFLLWIPITFTPQLLPFVGEPPVGTPAAISGLHQDDRILKVDDRPITFFSDLPLVLTDKLYGNGQVMLQVESPDGNTRQLVLRLPGEQVLTRDSNVFQETGLRAPIFIPPIIGAVSADSPAERAGLKAEDRVLRINQQFTASFQDISNYVGQSQGRPIQVEIMRGDLPLTFTVTPISQDQRLIVGIAAKQLDPQQFERYWISLRYRPFTALQLAASETVHAVDMTVRFLGRMVTGKISLNTASGPIGIANMSGQALSAGFFSFIRLAALLSLSLGVFNLLPIPVLDGGHLLSYVIEAIRGRPLPDKILIYAQYTGLSILLFLVILVSIQDVYRLLPN